MIWTIARKDLLGALRDGRVRAGAVLLFVLGVIALASAAARYSDLSRERTVAQALVEKQWQQQGEKNPHSAAHYGLYAFRPALPLAFFDPGVTAFEGVSIWLEAHKRNFAMGRPADDMTPLARFGELSLAFVFQALMPLALILLGYAALSAERESGTLRLVLSTGVTPLQLFAGKFVGLAAAFALLLAPLLILCMVGLLWSTGSAWLAHALVIVAAHSLYAALMLALTLIVSARATTSQSALLILLAFWSVTTFVLPRLAADIGRAIQPTPRAAEFAAGLESTQAAGLGGVSSAQRIADRKAALLKLYKVERDTDLPINFQGVVFTLQDELSNAAYDKQFAELDRAIDAQVSVIAAASALSPRMALGLLSQDIAGTSLQHQRHFERAAEDFRRRVMETLNRDITFNSRAGSADYRAGPELWRKVGAFQYSGESLRASLSRSGAPLMVLVLWSVALVFIGWSTMRRLRVLAS